MLMPLAQVSLKSSQVKSSTVIITGSVSFLQNTEIHSCVFSETTVSVEGENILISKCQFVNTTSEDQAILAITSRSNVFGDVVSDCVFEGNTGKADKGGILSFTSATFKSSLALYRNTFRHNIVAAKDLYGVINVAQTVLSLTVTNCQFDCNEYEEGEKVYHYPPIYLDRQPGNDRYRDNTFGSCPFSVSTHSQSWRSCTFCLEMHVNPITSATKMDCTLKQESFSASLAQQAPSLTKRGPLSAQAAQVFAPSLIFKLLSGQVINFF